MDSHRAKSSTDKPGWEQPDWKSKTFGLQSKLLYLTPWRPLGPSSEPAYSYFACSDNTLGDLVSQPAANRKERRKEGAAEDLTAGKDPREG